jgi:hypothetical protein
VPSIPPTSLAVASSSPLRQVAMSPAATTTGESTFSGGTFRTAAKGDEGSQEGHDNHRRGRTGSDASKHLPGFHGDRVAEGDSGAL